MCCIHTSRLLGARRSRYAVFGVRRLRRTHTHDVHTAKRTKRTDVRGQRRTGERDVDVETAIPKLHDVELTSRSLYVDEIVAKKEFSSTGKVARTDGLTDVPRIRVELSTRFVWPRVVSSGHFV